MRCVVCTCRCRRCADRERDVRAGTQRRLAGDTRVRRASQPCARGRAGHVVPRHSAGCTAGRRHGGSAGRVDADVDAGDRAGVARRCRSVSLCRVQRPRRARQRYRQRRRASTACVFVAYGLITIAIRARFEYDSTTIRLQHATTRYEVFRSLAYEIVYENQW